MMWNSLSKLMSTLPAQTVIYCSHEYTEANVAFALSVDPENPALIARAETVAALRSRNEPTIPTTMAEELATNPFLRASDKDIRAFLSLEDASDAAVFAEIRSRKDNF
jgi:hydroxyacylglutathione hydrolase